MDGVPHSGRENQQLLILEHAVDSTNEAFVTIDEFHRVLIFNKAAENMFGYSRDEVLGRDLDLIMTPACSRNHKEAVSRYVETRASRRIGHDTEILVSRKDGARFPAAISFSVTEVGGKLFFTALLRDLTETKALQEKIVRSERLAALGQFVAEVAHEIKNPLFTIGGFAEQLKRALHDEKSRKKAEIIAGEVERLEKLLSGLREYYTSKPLEMAPVSLRRIVEENHALMKDELEQKGIRIRMNLGDLDLIVNADSGKLKQAIFNLFKNAAEAMEETGGELGVELKADKGRAILAVSDTGPGISTENLEKLFSPFFTTKKTGTGLGLCLSKRIIEEFLDGSLTVKSTAGEGSTFTISLPLVQEAPMEEKRE